MTDHELRSEERAALRDLSRETPAPPHLEDRVVQALMERGLIGPFARPARRTPGWWWAGGAVASLLMFVMGFAMGRGSAEPIGRAPAETSRFVLLLYEGPDFDEATPATMPDRIREYGGWAGRVRERGQLVEGEKLEHTGRLLEPAPTGLTVSAAARTPSPSDELGGFFMIRARDYDEAVAIASSLPHLRYGGRILIRRVDPR